LVLWNHECLLINISLDVVVTLFGGDGEPNLVGVGSTINLTDGGVLDLRRGDTSVGLHL